MKISVKIFVKAFIVLLMVLLTTFYFTACGNKGKGGVTVVSGHTYVLESCIVDGDDATKTLAAMYNEYSFQFKEDGTCVETIVWSDTFAAMLDSSEPAELAGTYEQNGNIVTATFTYDGLESETVMEFIVGEDTLTEFGEEGDVTVFRLKADS